MVLQTNNLTKKYGRLTALNDFTLNIPKGTVYGILGPNGSGKTTTLAIVLDVLKQNNGTYHWFDETEPNHVSRRRIGSILETPNFYPYLSAEKNLKIAAAIKNIDESSVDRVLNIVGLAERRTAKYSAFSLGMKQRLSIAAALLGEPEVLLLDEPTNGLDPQGISEIRQLIIDVAQKGVTVIIASHLLDEVEKVCTHVAIIKKGNLLALGKVDEILSDDNILELKSDDLSELYLTLKTFSGIKKLEQLPTKIRLTLENEIPAYRVNQFLFENGIVLSHLESKKKSLEMQFLEITNENTVQA